MVIQLKDIETIMESGTRSTSITTNNFKRLENRLIAFQKADPSESFDAHIYVTFADGLRIRVTFHFQLNQQIKGVDWQRKLLWSCNALCKKAIENAGILDNKDGYFTKLSHDYREAHMRLELYFGPLFGHTNKLKNSERYYLISL